AASLVASAASLFDGTDPYGDALDWRTIDSKFENAIRLILNLRNRLRADCDEKTYVVILLDYLLIQIGGVTFGTTYNKIVSLGDLVLLVQHLIRWYRTLYPSSS